MVLRGPDLQGIILMLSRRGATVSGMVLDRTGQPVPGALVRLRAVPANSEFSDEQRAALPFVHVTHKATAAAADGSYRFVGVPAGKVVVTAESRGARAFADVSVADAQGAQITLRMQ
jgi:hypothetical protein